MIEAFFRELDRRWQAQHLEALQLQIIGSSALLLQTSYERGTKDSDVLETAQLTPKTKARLLELAGPGAELHQRHRLYLEVVARGLPFLPQRPRWCPLADLNASLVLLDLVALDVVDVVVSKLKRFTASDRHDIEAMIDRDLAPDDRVVARFCSAIDFNSMSAMADDFPSFIRNLHQVERDSYGVDESEIELPDWI